eukprot:879405-Prorocentrum_minimum.AAC.1
MRHLLSAVHYYCATIFAWASTLSEKTGGPARRVLQTRHICYNVLAAGVSSPLRKLQVGERAISHALDIAPTRIHNDMCDEGTTMAANDELVRTPECLLTQGLCQRAKQSDHLTDRSSSFRTSATPELYGMIAMRAGYFTP